MSDLVGNPEDRFSHDTAQYIFSGEKPDAFVPNMAYGRGRGQVSTLPGLGRGMAPAVGGQSMAPPPGFQPAFVVPNVNLIKNGVAGKLYNSAEVIRSLFDDN